MSKPSKRAKQTSSKPANPQYPSPFEKAPSSLDPFLGQLDPSQVYITHIDRSRVDYKRQIFLFSVLVNSSIAALLLWRIYAAAPTYLALVQTFLGYASTATVDTTTTTRKQQTWILLRRTLMMLCDFLLFRFIGPWPLTYFFERPANPVTWRWKVWFKPQEIVVRVSRNWAADDLMKGAKRGDDSPFFKTRIWPAIDVVEMQKTAYLQMGKNWDLDFELMQDAHYLIDHDEMKITDFEKLVLVYLDGGGWLVWKFDKSSDPEEENRKKMMAFRELLTSMGKESLFWKWQKIVEEERDADGGFSSETQLRIAKRVKEEFAKEGVDFDEAMESVGGVAALSAKPS